MALVFVLRCSVRQSLRWSTSQGQARSIGSISGAIHKGLHRDNDRRQRGAKPHGKGLRGWERDLAMRTKEARRQQAEERKNRHNRRRPSEDPHLYDDDARLGAAPRQQGRSRDARDDLDKPLRRKEFQVNTSHNKVDWDDDEQTIQYNASQPSESSSTSYPLSVPHTTASSQFLYGYSSVYAALVAKRRQFYKLYIHARADARKPQNQEQEHNELRRLAKVAGVQIVRDPDVKLLDKMSEGRSHNGVVLEASPLPISPIASVSAMEGGGFTTVSNVGKRSNAHKSLHQHPILLLLDDIHDLGNLGAILRSAYFLGVDAVILTEHVAPLNAVTLKASSGAAEAMTIFRVGDPGELLRKSRVEGWSIVAATTPGQAGKESAVKGKGPGGRAASETMKVVEDEVKGVRYHLPPHPSHVHNLKDLPHMDPDLKPLFGRPTVLVVGGEGRGLRRFITRYASAFMEISSPREKAAREVGMDSLNVSATVGIAVMEVLSRMRESASLSRDQRSSEDKSRTKVTGESKLHEADDENRIFDLTSAQDDIETSLAEDEDIPRSTGSLPTPAYS